MHVTAIKQNGGLFIPNIAHQFGTDTVSLVIHTACSPFNWAAWLDDVQSLDDESKTFLDNRTDAPPKAVEL